MRGGAIEKCKMMCRTQNLATKHVHRYFNHTQLLERHYLDDPSHPLPMTTFMQRLGSVI